MNSKAKEYKVAEIDEETLNSGAEGYAKRRTTIRANVP
jgi:hypothetical protein